MIWTDPTGEPGFPPLFSGRRVVPGVSVFDEAARAAQAGHLGAGDVFWDPDPTRVALAIVLEPDVQFRKAAQMLPVAMVAAGDCIGALAPPQVAVMFRWPRTISVNGASVGHVRVISATKDAAAVPDWLVVGADLRMRSGDGAAEPGTMPDTTTLGEEGCEDLSHVDIMASFARHFLTWLNIWQDDGFEPVHRSWLERAEEPETARRFDGVSEPATISGMDEDGNLLVRCGEETRMLALTDAIEIIDAEAAR